MGPVTDKKTKIWLALMKFGAKVGCHQMPERSFSYKGYQFPVCARCTGVLFGEIVSIVFILLSVRINLIYSMVLILPLAIDGGLQYIKIWKSNNLRRVLTGIFAGFGLTYVYYHVISFIISMLLKLF